VQPIEKLSSAAGRCAGRGCALVGQLANNTKSVCCCFDAAVIAAAAAAAADDDGDDGGGIGFCHNVVDTEHCISSSTYASEVDPSLLIVHDILILSSLMCLLMLVQNLSRAGVCAFPSLDLPRAPRSRD